MTEGLRYRRLGYVALNVSDVGRSLDFYEKHLGLQRAGEAMNGEHLLRCSRRHHDVILHQADEAGLRRIGWEMEDADNVTRARDLYRSLGIPIVDVGVEECTRLGVHDAVPRVGTAHRRDLRIFPRLRGRG